MNLPETEEGKAAEYIAKALPEIDKYGLTPEVIVWAIKWAQMNPELSILEAFEAGCTEWDI